MKLFATLLEKWQDRLQNHSFTCDSCNGELFDYPVHRFCAACEGKLLKNDKQYCDKCGRKTITEGVCSACKTVKPLFTKGYSPFVYQGYVSALINRLKNGDKYLAYYFAEQMTAYLLSQNTPTMSEFTQENPLLIFPVPMTNEDRKERGYNQAETLARIIANTLKKSDIAVEVDNEVLIKTKRTPPQKQRTFSERAENVKGAFHVHKRTKCKGKTVLLVDDVMTTGATGSECAARLFGAGAKEVIFLAAVSLPEQK